MNTNTQNNQDSIILDFKNLVRKRLGENVLMIKLFGSRARGENDEYSDYDFLVVVDKKEKDFKEKLIDISVEILNKYDKLVGFILWDKKEWQWKRKLPIGLNILKEGIEL